MANKYLKNDEAFKNNNVMEFQVLTKDSVEKFSLYDAHTKKYFPENTKVVLEAGETEVTKYVKLSENDKKRFTRKPQFMREILFNGEKRFYGMTKTMEDGLKELFNTVESLDQNPLDKTYSIKKIPGDIPLNTRYTVSIVKKDAKLPAPEVDFELSLEEPEPLNEKEIVFINAVKNQYPEYKSRPVPIWSNLMVKKLGCSHERATHVITNHLFK